MVTVLVCGGVRSQVQACGPQRRGFNLFWMTSRAYIHGLGPSFHTVLVHLTSSRDPTNISWTLGKSPLRECFGNTSSGNIYSCKIKIELFHHFIEWWLIKSECENWNSLTFLWTNKWWLHKYCSESMKPSELVLLSPGHTALHTGNPCGMRSLWKDARLSAHPRSSPRSGSARRSEGSFLMYPDCCVRLSWAQLLHSLSAVLDKESRASFVGTQSVQSHTAPRQEKALCWLSCSAVSIWKFFNKGLPFLFCTEPANYAGSPDQEAADLRVELHRQAGGFICSVSWISQCPEQCPHTGSIS